MASGLLPVEEALARILSSALIKPTENVPLLQARGRTLAADIAAKLTQPPFNSSAMDGYAVRGADVSAPGARLRRVGESAAGHSFSGAIHPGECARIFTGAPLPSGADTILIQENADIDGDHIITREAEISGKFVRPAGLDFKAGDILLKSGTCLGAREVALAAAMNHPSLPVFSRPRVAILATGDELVLPGENPGPDQIIASNNFAVASMVEAAGGIPVMLPIARDTFESLEQGIAQAKREKADILVTIGGASVGDHDLVQSALAREGMMLDFWRIAMRPGKPLMFGRLGDMRLIGLPGNPVSSIICSLVFLHPLIRAMLGDGTAGDLKTSPAILGEDLPSNDMRQDYIRARITGEKNGIPVVCAHRRQDSSMLSTFAASDALIIRAPFAPSAQKNSSTGIIYLNHVIL